MCQMFAEFMLKQFQMSKQYKQVSVISKLFLRGFPLTSSACKAERTNFLIRVISTGVGDLAAHTNVVKGMMPAEMYFNFNLRKETEAPIISLI